MFFAPSMMMLHWLPIDVGIDFALMFYVSLIVFLFANATSKAFINNVFFSIKLEVFTHQKNMSFYGFHYIFRYWFWHWLWWLRASILHPFWQPFGIQFHFVSQSFFDDVRDIFLIDMYQKCFPFRAKGRSPFGYFFASWPLLFPSMCFGTSLWLTLAPFWLPFNIVGIFSAPF